MEPSAQVAEPCQNHQVLAHRYLAERRTSISEETAALIPRWMVDQNQPIHAYNPPYRRGEMKLRGMASARK